MPASPIDSGLYGALFGDPELARLFSDSAEVRAMLLVEGALAEAQGKLGLIPETAAAFLKRACAEVQVDPTALAETTATNAVPVPGLVAATRKALEAPDHAAWLHFGATSQDIMDTALTLRLRQVTRIMGDRLAGALKALGKMAEAHADLPMMARTYGQAAVPSTFGAAVASWGSPLLRHLDRLYEVPPRLLVVSLSGAAGTLSAMGDKGPEVRKLLAQSLDLSDPEESWHSSRDRIAEFAGWMTALAASLGKMGEDLILMTMRGEVSLKGAGGSSTMPQKQNPVGPSVLSALARHATGLNVTLQSAALHREARDGAAWMSEWLTLPQLILTTGRALTLAQDVAGALTPDADGLRAPLDAPPQAWAAEALTFALAETMPRPEAQDASKALVAEALKTNAPLPALAAQKFPGTDWAAKLAPEALLGEAPALARRFAARAQEV